MLFAALLHASWNALVKSTSDKLVSITAVTLGHAPFAIITLFFIPAPSPESWPYIAASIVVHTLYQLSLVRAYRLGDFTQVYPIARGTGPALVTLFSIIVLGWAISSTQILAISLIITGIFCLSLLRQSDGVRNPKAVGAALLTGTFIATYSLIDGLGARQAGTAIGFIAWMTICNAIVFAVIATIIDRTVLKRVMLEGQKPLWIGGTASVVAYMLVVWAMTKAPIAIVTALRETSTIFALVIGALLLGERFSWTKVIATCLTLCGVILVRFY